MNPRTNIFSGFGVYTKARGVDNPDFRRGGTFIRDTVISPSPHMQVFSGDPASSIFSGFGAVTCPPAYMEFPAGTGLCVPTISMPSSGCPAGTSQPWPSAGFCLPTVMPSALPPGMIAQFCPSGQFGYPPYCFPIGTPLPPGSGPPPGGVDPAPFPQPVPPPVAPPPALPPEGTAPDATKTDWVVPVVVGVGVLALVGIAVASRRRATPNRRRRVRRRR